MKELTMRPRWAVLIVISCAVLTWGVATLLMNIAERKWEGKLLQRCPCPSESCRHPSRSVK